MKKVLPKDELTGERVCLRKHDVSFARVIYQAIDEDRERLREFLPWVDFMKSAQDEEDFLKSQPEKWESGQEFNFRIHLKAGDGGLGEFVGMVGTHSISFQHERLEIGYWIRSKFEGQGLITEAVSVLQKELFGIGFHRLEIHCSSSNEKSAKVPRRLGYQQEALLRENAIENSHFRNTLVFAKLVSDV